MASYQSPSNPNRTGSTELAPQNALLEPFCEQPKTPLEVFERVFSRCRGRR